jgi:protein-S-isoprenylcysteine O-methyltransferase Ste14
VSIQHDIFRLLYLIGYVVAWAVRAPRAFRVKRSAIVDDRKTSREVLLLALLFAGTLVMPLAHVSSPWFDFADYVVPAWTGAAGTVVFAFAIWLLCWSHAVLGRNWSPTLRIREGHHLVAEGPYQYVRHPIYTAHWLWALAQPLLLHNWVAGFSALVAVAPLYFLRVRREEQMMLEHFGEQYRSYMARTGRLVPRLRRRGTSV